MHRPETPASNSERMFAFETQFAKAQATEIVDLGWGYALLQSDFPDSFNHNRIVVTSEVEASEVIAAADRVLGGRGLEHRLVSFEDNALGQAARADFVKAGYEHETIVAMVHTGAVPPPSGHEVRAVSLEELRPALIRDWRADLPEATEDQLRQLADRTSLYARGADVTMLAVFEGDEIASRAGLYMDVDAGVAQFESLQTGAAFRGRGYADAVVREGLRRGRAAGCDLVFLTADANDWPADWYRRHGYADVHRTHHFERAR